MSKISVNEEGVGPLERGRRLYQQKDYPGALKAFSDAIKMSSGSLQLTALDHRAAVYEKTGQLQAALRDSKQMIDLKPELAKGYLRCGKVLQVKGEKDLALKIYERGLRKVKIGADNDRTMLQSMFNKLRQALDPGKCLDPLAFLPLELAQMVVQNLEMRDLVICLAVSKPWKSLLESSRDLWKTLDTTSAWRPVTLKSLKAYLRRSNYTLDKAIIDVRGKFSADRMEYLARTCKHLRHLQITGGGVIGNSLTVALPFAQSLSVLIVSGNCEIGPTAILSALKTCQKTLVNASFLRIHAKRDEAFYQWPNEWPKMESLKSLDLRIPLGQIIPIDMNTLRDSIPNIKSLTLVGFPPSNNQRVDLIQCAHLEYLCLSSDGCNHLPTLPRTVRYLNLSGCSALTATSTEDDEVFDLPHLEGFDCRETQLQGPMIKRITSRSIGTGSLKSLSVGERFVDHAGQPIGEVYPASKSVTELSLSGLSDSEDRIMAIANLYPNLERLDVSKTMVTGVAIKEFVNAGITWLNCKECYRISPDAIEYARGRGVVVEFSFPTSTATFRDNARMF